MKRLLPFYLNVFASYLSVSMMVIVFTLLLFGQDNPALADNLSLAQKTNLFGLLISLYPLGQFLGSPAIGAFSDHFGRKPTTLFTLGLSIISYAMIAACLQFQAITLLCFALFFAGLFESNIALTQNVIADLYEGKKRVFLYGYLGTTTSVAYIIGPLLIGVLFTSSLIPWFNEATPFWFITLLIAVTFVWIAVGFKETHPHDKRVKVRLVQALTNIKNIVADREMRPFYLLSFICASSIFGLFRFLPVYLTDEFHLSTDMLSIFFAFCSVPTLFNTLYLIKPLMHRYSALQIFRFATLAVAPLGLGLVFTPIFAWTWFFAFVYFLFSSLVLTTLIPLVSNQTTAQRQGRVMGNNMSVLLLTQIVIGPLGGYLAGIWTRLPLLFCVVLMLIGGLYSLRLKFKPA